jgi:hypothetical protein
MDSKVKVITKRLTVKAIEVAEEADSIAKIVK